jgi:hypothetical protein
MIHPLWDICYLYKQHNEGSLIWNSELPAVWAIIWAPITITRASPIVTICRMKD